MWRAVFLEARREALAEHYLKGEGFIVFFPKVRKRRWMNGKTIWLKRPYFPRYGFCDLPEGRTVRRSFGVHGIVQANGCAVPIPEAVMGDLMGRVDAEGIVRAKPIRPGGTYRVGEGVFCGLLMLVESLSDSGLVVGWINGWRVQLRAEVLESEPVEE